MSVSLAPSYAHTLRAVDFPGGWEGARLPAPCPLASPHALAPSTLEEVGRVPTCPLLRRQPWLCLGTTDLHRPSVPRSVVAANIRTCFLPAHGVSCARSVCWQLSTGHVALSPRPSRMAGGQQHSPVCPLARVRVRAFPHGLASPSPRGEKLLDPRLPPGVLLSCLSYLGQGDPQGAESCGVLSTSRASA